MLYTAYCTKRGCWWENATHDLDEAYAMAEEHRHLKAYVQADVEPRCGHLYETCYCEDCECVVCERIEGSTQ